LGLYFATPAVTQNLGSSVSSKRSPYLVVS
jgi:hypothetical protein